MELVLALKGQLYEDRSFWLQALLILLFLLTVSSSIKSLLHHHKQSKIIMATIRRSIVFPLKPPVSDGFKTTTAKMKRRVWNHRLDQGWHPAVRQANLMGCLFLYGPDFKQVKKTWTFVFSLIPQVPT